MSNETQVGTSVLYVNKEKLYEFLKEKYGYEPTKEEIKNAKL